MRIAEEKGNVAVLVALSMMMIFGFMSISLDVGGLFLAKQHAQAAVDAGALAGADALLSGASAATDTAVQIAQTNDSAASYTAVADTTADTVTVTASQTVPTWFAKVLGKTSVNFSVSAQARIGSLTQATGMVPIAVANQTFTYGEEVYLSQGAGSGSSGNYGYLDLAGNGASGFETAMEYGYDQPLYVGEQVPTKTGNMVGPVQTAINYRLQESENDPSNQSYETVHADSPRVLYLPVIDSFDVSGSKPVTIVGFAAFYLEGLVGSGGHQQIEGRFIRMVRQGDVGPRTDYGTYSVQLSQ